MSNFEQLLLYELYTFADAEGHFEFPKVSPGAVLIAPIHQGERVGVFRHATIVTVEPNATAHVTIGGSGARVIGRVVPQPERSDIRWMRSPQHLRPKKRNPDLMVNYN